MSHLKREVITNSRISPELSRLLINSGIERIRACIQCGTCTASCPSTGRTAYRTRMLIRKILLGLKEETLASEDLWLCTTCYTCSERCPRKIEVTNAILLLRNLAVKEGFMLGPHRDVARHLIAHGHAVPIDEETKKKRERLELPTLPLTVHSFPTALNEVQTLLKIAGFEKLVEHGEKQR